MTAILTPRVKAAAGDESDHRTERLYAALVHSLKGVLWEADPGTFRFTFVSPFAERLLGYPVRDWLDDPDFWCRHVHPDDRDRGTAIRRRAVAAGRDHELEYRTVAADGRVVWLQDIVTVELGPDGRPARLRGIMVD